MTITTSSKKLVHIELDMTEFEVEVIANHMALEPAFPLPESELGIISRFALALEEVLAKK